MCKVASHGRNAPCRLALWSDDSRHQGAPRDVTEGVARATALALITIFVLQVKNTDIQEVKLKLSYYNCD